VGGGGGGRGKKMSKESSFNKPESGLISMGKIKGKKRKNNSMGGL